MRDRAVSPNDGGCWFCFGQDDDLVFCCEFDCYVHPECAKHAAQKDPTDREAEIILAELESMDA